MSRHTITVEHNEEEVEVTFDFFPAECRTHDNPGCKAEVCIVSAMRDGRPMALTASTVRDLERAVRNSEAA